MSYKTSDITASPEKVMMEGITAGAAKPSGKAIYEQRKNYGKTAAALGEISQYNVEHLVTFAIEKKDGVHSVEDSIRKLKLLDLRNKVWAQEVLLQVDEKDVKLFDIITQEELELFPLHTVQHVEASSTYDVYNILALLVKDNEKNADIHLFHCPTVAAEIIALDIDSASSDFKDKKGKKKRPETLRRHKKMVAASVIPPPPTNPPPAPPMKDNMKEMSWVKDMEEEESPRKSNSELSLEMREAKVSRDVAILNHTLDDIEIFANKLRKSAEAMKDLTVRKSKKSSRNQKSKRAPGEGVLMLRTKLPPEPHFVDCYKKFKFAFNCLARLKTQLKNPSAIELVHFLFAPLEMSVNCLGSEKLARAIEAPLLTHTAVDLMTSCLTTKEAEFWRRLGDYWTRPRSNFPNDHYIAPYIPVFYSGWEPPPLATLSGSGQSATDLAATIQLQADRVQKAEKERRNSSLMESSRKDTSQQDAFKQHVEDHVNRNHGAHGSAPMSRTNSQEATMCRSMYLFNGRNKNELSVQRDEILEVLDNSKAWWKCRTKEGNVGHIPGNYMVVITSARPVSPPSPPPYSPPKAELVPPPPPPTTRITPVPIITKPSLKSSSDEAIQRPTASVAPSKSAEQFHEELRKKMTLQSKQARNFSIPKKNSSSAGIKISAHSSPQEVKMWLKSHGFSDVTNDSLGVLNGEQIFTLTKDDLRQVCDDEGSRVYSQLLVQKSLQMEASKTDSELERIMKKRQNIANNNTTETAAF